MDRPRLPDLLTRAEIGSYRPALARAREIIGKFKFGDNIPRLDEAGLLYLVRAEFARPELDLHPRRVSSVQMGHISGELGTRPGAEATSAT